LCDDDVRCLSADILNQPISGDTEMARLYAVLIVYIVFRYVNNLK